MFSGFIHHVSCLISGKWSSLLWYVFTTLKREKKERIYFSSLNCDMPFFRRFKKLQPTLLTQNPVDQHSLDNHNNSSQSPVDLQTFLFLNLRTAFLFLSRHLEPMWPMEIGLATILIYQTRSWKLRKKFLVTKLRYNKLEFWYIYHCGLSIDATIFCFYICGFMRCMYHLTVL